MCTTVEIAETRVLPTGLAGTAWVRPVYDGEGFEAVVGVKNEDPACRGWSDATGKGFTVDPNGSFCQGTIPEGCTNLHSISCCTCSGSVIGGGEGDDALSCNTTKPIVYSALSGKVTVTVEVRSACPSGVDINLVDTKKGGVTTQNVPAGGIEISTLSPKSEQIQVVPAKPEAGSFRVEFTVN
jgi:hypothetical protein